MKILLGAFLALSAALYAAEMPNLLKNGSFEEGVNAKGIPVGWSVSMSDGVDGVVELSDEHVYHGKKSLHLNKKNTRGSVYVMQAVRLKPNTEYILEFKGFRSAGFRWHYVGCRQPDCKVRAEGKIPNNGGAVPPIRFRTDVKKTLCYVHCSLWGYTKENNKGTIGEMWIDEVSLRELPRIAGTLSGVASYYFATDSVKGAIHSADFKGEAVITVKAANGKTVSKTAALVPGDNPFEIAWKNLPEGEAVLSVEGGDIHLSENFMIQKERE